MGLILIIHFYFGCRGAKRDPAKVFVSWGGIMLKQVVLLSVALLLQVGCSGGGGGGDAGPVNRKGDPIIPERQRSGDMVFPSGEPRFVSLIKLNEPALMATAVRQADGTYKIDKAAKDAVVQEQQEFEAKLKAVSPDIKILYSYKMVLNAVAIDAPQAVANDLLQLDMSLIEADESFDRPATLLSGDDLAAKFGKNIHDPYRS